MPNNANGNGNGEIAEAGRAIGGAASGAATMFMRLVERLGVSTVLLGIVLWFLWTALTWFAANIATPIKDSHVKFLSKIEQSVDQQTEIIEKMEQTQAEIGSDLRASVKTQEQIIPKIDSLHEKVDKIKGRDP